MKENSLDAKKHETSSSSSSMSDTVVAIDGIPVHSFRDRDESDLAFIQREIRDSTLRRESYLDKFCEKFADEKSAYSGKTSNNNPKVSKLEFTSTSAVANNHGSIFQTQATHHADHNGKPNGSVGRKPAQLDLQKKTSLLATLKNIDNEGLEH